MGKGYTITTPGAPVEQKNIADVIRICAPQLPKFSHDDYRPLGISSYESLPQTLSNRLDWIW